MRTLLKLSIPVESGNRAVKDGTLERVIGDAIARLRPEASYFYPENGRRSCLMVFDLKNVADIPMIAESFFLELNAAVDFTPVMNAEDLKKGLGSRTEEHAAVGR
jgi:hypothetical protein